jgi:hypothetical protein
MSWKFVSLALLGGVWCAGCADAGMSRDEPLGQHEGALEQQQLPPLPDLPPVEEVIYTSVVSVPVAPTVLAPRDAAPNNDARYDVFIGREGRHVVLSSDASNWVEDDANASTDVFRVNRRSGRAKRVSVGDQGEELAGIHFAVAASADTCTVAFLTLSDESQQAGALRVWDCEVERSRLIEPSVPLQRRLFSEVDRGTAGLSADGRFLAFGSSLFNLESGVRVAVPRDPSLSASFLAGNGRHVLFEDGGETPALKAFSRRSGAVQGVWARVDYDITGFRKLQDISRDGRTFAFDASFWPAYEYDGAMHAFAASLVDGEVLQLSSDPAVDWQPCIINDALGTTAYGQFARISLDGTVAAFASCRALNVVDLTSRSLRRFAWPGTGFGPTALDLSPDGKHLAFLTVTTLPSDTHPGTAQLPEFVDYPAGPGDFGRDVFVLDLD